MSRSALTAIEFAQAAGISRQAAIAALRSCQDGRTWRGHKLRVICMRGRGPRGVVYLVDLASLPSDLRAKLPVPAPEPVPAPVAPLPVPRSAASGLMAWQLAVVERIKHGAPARSAGRAELIRRMVAELRWPDGKKRGRPVGETTVRQWIKAYETGGMGQLARKPRTDQGKSRVTVTRRWDAFAAATGIEATDCELMAKALCRYLRSAWRTNQSVSMIVMAAEHKLATWTRLRIAGEVDDAALRQACQLPDNLVRRDQHFRGLGIKANDAGRSAAVQTNRIIRSRRNLRPMEWVAADVHHLDILVKRPDGSTATPKLVAFADLATNRIFYRVFLMGKREAIRREHVLETFAAMLMDPAWGRPRRLYFDNGGEFNWSEQAAELLRAFDQRSMADLDGDLVERCGETPPGVTRSLPYNPQSKVIEALFHSIEKTVLPLIFGHIGGDRFRKKTQNQGHEPLPFPGSWEDFGGKLDRAFVTWHAKRQRGHLAGQSPNDRFAELAAGCEWQAELVDGGELHFLFAESITRVVNTGGVLHIGNERYRHDALARYAGLRKKVIVRRPIYGPKHRLWVLDDKGKTLCIVEPDQIFAFGDPAGAVEQGRRQRELLRDFREMKRETDVIDLAADAYEAAIAGPAVHVPVPGAVISFDPMTKKAAAMMRSKPRAEPKSETMQNRLMIDALHAQLKAG